MKMILCVLFLFFIGHISFSQKKRENEYTRDYCLKKARSKRTTGHYLLYGGLGLTAAGAIINYTDNDEGIFEGVLDYTPGDGLMSAGIYCLLFSIPFFISSHNFSKMAAHISTGTGFVPSPPGYRGPAGKWQPSISIGFNIR